MKRMVVWILIILAVLHHDFWFWHDSRLVLGFLPVGLAYHIFFSVLSGVCWAFVVFFAWPEEWVEKIEGRQR